MDCRADDLRLRALLVERLGVEATDKLLERLSLTPVENFATKDDIAALRGELLGDFGNLRGEFGELKAKLMLDLANTCSYPGFTPRGPGVEGPPSCW